MPKDEKRDGFAKMAAGLLLGGMLSLYGAQEGERLYSAMGCYGCHGVHGEGLGSYPKLAGKPQSYLVQKLHRLKKGIGHTSKRNQMIPFAKALDETQIQAITRYLSRQLGEKRSEDETPYDIMGGMDP